MFRSRCPENVLSLFRSREARRNITIHRSPSRNHYANGFMNIPSFTNNARKNYFRVIYPSVDRITHAFKLGPIIIPRAPGIYWSRREWGKSGKLGFVRIFRKRFVQSFLPTHWLPVFDLYTAYILLLKLFGSPTTAPTCGVIFRYRLPSS